MKLLVTGNIGYITTEFIKEAFPECQILLLGETALKSDRRKGISVHPMPHAEKEFVFTRIKYFIPLRLAPLSA